MASALPVRPTPVAGSTVAYERAKTAGRNRGRVDATRREVERRAAMVGGREEGRFNHASADQNGGRAERDQLNSCKVAVRQRGDVEGVDIAPACQRRRRDEVQGVRKTVQTPLEMFCRFWELKVTSGLAVGNLLTQPVPANHTFANCKRRGYTAKARCHAEKYNSLLPLRCQLVDASVSIEKRTFHYCP